jgi:hypothetical protein
MARSTGPRNRLAKPLPQQWREHLIAQGVPKRKSIAVCRATLADGRVFDSLIIQDGWIISTTRDHLTGDFEQRIEFDPRTIAALDVLQTA